MAIKVDDIKVDDEFRSLIPALTDDQLRGLRDNILSDGCFIDPLICWNGILLDGHSRIDIWDHLPVDANVAPPWIVELDLPSREAAHDWIIDHAVRQRNLSESQIAYEIGKKYNLTHPSSVATTEALGQRCHNADNGKDGEDRQTQANDDGLTEHTITEQVTAEDIARETGVTARTVRRHGKFSEALDVIGKVDPKFASDIRSEAIKPPRADIILISKMDRESLVKALSEIREHGQLVTPGKPPRSPRKPKKPPTLKATIGKIEQLVKKTSKQVMVAQKCSGENEYSRKMTDLITEVNETLANWKQSL